LQLLPRELPSLAEWIEDVRLGLIFVTDEEMAGKADARDRQIRAPRDLDHNYRQRDRKPGAPIEDFVEVTVPGIVVIVGVSTEPFFVEEHTNERVDTLQGGRFLSRKSAADALSKPFEAFQVARHVQVRI